MMRGPKIELILERYSTSSDGGGGLTKIWTQVRKISGMLTFVNPDERIRADKETTHIRYQFWCHYIKGLNISTKDEFSKIGTSYRFRIVAVDDVLEQSKLWKIDLLQVK